MANQFLVSIDLNRNQILDGRFEVVPTAPASGVSYEGRIIYAQDVDSLQIYADNGSGTFGWRTLVWSATSTTAQLNVAGVGTNEIELSLDASSANIADYLVLRDGSGNFSAGTITATFSGNLTGNVTGQVSDISNHNTDDLAEGTTNLYYTDARVQANSIDQLQSAAADVSMGGNKLTNVATPTADTDAANKAYVDAARSGLDVKASVRVATTANIDLTQDLENGDTIDGITLATGDRVLVKDQSTASQNGIYVVVASGAASRATDADIDAEVTPGMFTFVEEGSTYADTGWVLATDAPISVGVTGLTFNQFSGAGTYTAGAGLTLTGGEFSVNVANGVEINSNNVQLASTVAGNGLAYAAGVLSVNVVSTGGLQITADSLEIKLNSSIAGLQTDASGLAIKSDIASTGLTYTSGALSVNAIDLTSASGGGVSGILPIANGGTNAGSEAAARASLAGDVTVSSPVTTPNLAVIVTKPIGDGINTSYTVDHNFNSRKVIVQVFDSANYDTVFADVVRTDPDYVTVTFASAPSSGAYTVVITGMVE